MTDANAERSRPVQGRGGLFGGTTKVAIGLLNSALRSNTTARIVDLVSEGPIVGLSYDLQSIYFDDVPLQNPDGSFNFMDTGVVMVSGTPDQAVLPGFSAVESETAVDVAVTATTPLTREVSNLQATAVRVTVKVAALFSADAETGDQNPTSVNVAVDLAASGGPFVEVVNDVISGKTTTPYARAYRIELTGAGPWSVRVRRITPDSSALTLQNASAWYSYTTIEDYQFNYPNSALVGLTINAKAFGESIPRRSYEIDGLRIAVPNNYNAATRAYSGLWDGTFATAWTDNPAWVFYDLLTNTRYGLGEFIAATAIDKYALYTIAQYCDELVPDGSGGQEPRYTFNGVIANAGDALAVLNTVAAAFRGMLYHGAGGVTAVADRPGDPVKVIAPANVSDGTFNYSGAALKARHTFARVSWFNPENGYKQDIESVEASAADIAKWGFRPTEVVAVGCTSRGQANRFGRWILDSESSETETCTWTASHDQADLLPGDIVLIADPAYAGADFGGRLAEVVTGIDGVIGIVIDRPVALSAGVVYTCNLVLPDGRVVERTLTNAAGATSQFDFAQALPDTPVTGAMWSLSSAALAPRSFRVLSIEETDKHLFKITALVHDTTKYARIEQDIVLEAPAFTLLPSGKLLPPTALAISESITLAGGVTPRNKTTISIGPSPDTRVTFYEVAGAAPGQDFETLVTTGSLSADVFDLKPGVWAFRVRGLDSLGRFSEWFTLDGGVTLHGLELPPDDPAEPRIVYVDSNLSISWNEVIDPRPIRYALRKGDSWDGGLELGTVAHPPFAAHGDGTYWVKSYAGPDASRVYCAGVISITVSGVSLTTNVVASHDEKATGWTGKFTGTVGSAVSFIHTGAVGDILTEPDVLTLPDVFGLGEQGSGTYEIPEAHYVDVGRVAPCRVTCTWKGSSVQANADFLGNPDMLGNPDFLGAGSGALVEVYAEVSVAVGELLGDVYSLDPTTNPANDVYAEADIYSVDVSFGPWQRYEPGVYLGRVFRARLVLITHDPQVKALALEFSFSVDVPDRVDHWTDVTIPDTGLAVVFTPDGGVDQAPFNGGVGSDPLPHIQITNTSGSVFDFEVTSLTLSGCTIFAKQAGVAATAANTNITFQGY